jgi:hypothetical protein
LLIALHGELRSATINGQLSTIGGCNGFRINQ